MRRLRAKCDSHVSAGQPSRLCKEVVVIREVLKLISGEEPYRGLADGLNAMLRHAASMFEASLEGFWSGSTASIDGGSLSQADVLLNQQERQIRKELLLSLSLSRDYSPAPILTLMSVIKDVERMGDYAKELAELRGVADRLPQDAIVDELREMGTKLSADLRDLAKVIASNDRKGALRLTLEGRARAQRFKVLLGHIAHQPYSAEAASVLSLATHYQRRIQGHALNVLSSVLMPLHKLDYFDEDVARASND